MEILKPVAFVLCTGFIYFFMLYLFIKFINKKKQILIEKELTLFINNMISSLKAGISPVSFFSNYSKSSSPLKQIIDRILGRISAGQSLIDSLVQAQKEINMQIYNTFFNAIILSLGFGGNLSLTLEKVKKISIDQIKLKRFIKVKTAQLKLQALVMGLLPIFIFLFLYFFHPERAENLFNSNTGRVVLLIGISLQIAGALLINIIIKKPLKNEAIGEFISFIDLLSLSISSGKSLTGAVYELKKIRFSGKIKDFYELFQDEINKGKSFIESFALIKKFYSSPVCDQVIFVLKENIAFGIPIRKTLDDLSTDIREELTAQIAEDIEKLPIKLLLPLMLFIAPATMILILFPIIFL